MIFGLQKRTAVKVSNAVAVAGLALSSILVNGAAVAQHVPGSECIDSDGDGWGWNGTASCRIETTSAGTCVDNDGDGWGWTGTASCRIGGNNSSAGACVDSDGDGWGWDGTASCRIDSGTTSGACIDTDGDGWGWDGVQSCRLDSPNLNNIVDTAVAAGNFTILAAALQATGLDATLSDSMAEFTVFAPTDRAFELLGQDTIDALVADPDTLSQILLSHVVPGTVDAAAAIGLAGSVVDTAGDRVAVSVNGGELFVNTSQVVATDIMASNGIIHVLDTVILPRPQTVVSGTIVDVAVANGSFNTLVAALQATGLDAVLADADAEFTVFAPTDDAFAALGDDTIAALLSDTDTLSSILLTHVVGAAVDSLTALSLTGNSVETVSGTSVDLSIQSNQLYINNSQVIIADIVTDNGIIHVIDAVIQ